MSRSLATALVLAVALAACQRSVAPARRIVCIGDSITLGTTRGGEANGRDIAGGYVGRLAARLGPSVEVIGRGVGGATATLWLSPVGDALGRAAIETLSRVGPPVDAADAHIRVVDAVLASDRPDVVVLLLGTNDLFLGDDAPDDVVVARTAGELRALYDRIAAGGRRVLVGTVLPTRRPIAARRAALARRLHAELDGSVVPLGERFEAAGWEQLLADDVHPNEAGYERLAAILVDELAARDIVPAK